MLASDSGLPLRLEGLASSPPTPTLASDSGPPLRPKGLTKEERRSLPTSTRLSDREYIEPLLIALPQQGGRSRLGNDRLGTPAR